MDGVSRRPIRYTMKYGAPVVLFVSAISILLILNLYHLQEDALRSSKLEEQLLDTIHTMKCPEQKCPECPEEKICPSCPEKKCPSCPSVKCPSCPKEKICEKCPKCSECPIQDLKCPEQEICSTLKPLPCPKNVIKMPEMTEVLNDRDFSKEAIFFTETSGKGAIKPRFVCALESAARAYPLGDVYLLVAYNPTDELDIESNEALNMVLQHHGNIQVLNVDMDKLFEGTPLEEFHHRGVLHSSDYLSAHTSDVLRFLTLWLYGGKYFDLDVVTVSNLTGIDNFIVDESRLPHNYIASCAFGFEKHSPIGEFIFHMLNNEFHGDQWADNGPRVITDAMRWYTKRDLAIHMNPSNLKEFHKLRYEQIFPIEYFELLLYFEEKDTEYAMKRINSVNNLIGMHVGNNNIHTEKVVVGSKQAYSLIAQKYCPRSYWSAHMFF